MNELEDQVHHLFAAKASQAPVMDSLGATVSAKVRRRKVRHLATGLAVGVIILAGIVIPLRALSGLGATRDQRTTPGNTAVQEQTMDQRGRTVLATDAASFGPWTVSVDADELCFQADEAPNCAPLSRLGPTAIATTGDSLAFQTGMAIVGQVGSDAAKVRVTAFDGKAWDGRLVDLPDEFVEGSSRVFVVILEGYSDGGDYTVTALDANGSTLAETSAGGNPMANSYVGADPLPDSGQEYVDALRQALEAANSFRATNGTFVGFTPEAAAQLQPRLAWSTRESSAAGIVVIEETTPDSLLLTVHSEGNDGYCIASSPSGVAEAAIAAESIEGCSRTHGLDLLAQDHLRDAADAAMDYHQTRGSFSGLDAQELGSQEQVSHLGFTDGRSTDGWISVRLATDGSLLLVTSLEPGSYYCIAHVVKEGDVINTKYGAQNAADPAECDRPAAWGARTADPLQNASEQSA